MSYYVICEECDEAIVNHGNAETDFKKAIVEHEEVCEANDEDEDDEDED